MTKGNEVLNPIDDQAPNGEMKTSGNYDAVKYNAMTHGILSRHTVLPHEDRNEFETLLSLLTKEHQPQGMTETHLVEELTGIMWRKQRVLQAESAKINKGLNSTSSRSGSVYSDALPFHSGVSKDDIKLSDLLRMTPDEVIEFQHAAKEELQDIMEAIRFLELKKPEYQAALDQLCDEDRDWWKQTLEDEDNEESADDLLSFIRDNLKPWYKHQQTIAIYHAEIKAQALGEGIQPLQIEKLNRYEAHLDRKFQRTLAMLIKLKELRNA